MGGMGLWPIGEFMVWPYRCSRKARIFDDEQRFRGQRLVSRAKQFPRELYRFPTSWSRVTNASGST